MYVYTRQTVIKIYDILDEIYFGSVYVYAVPQLNECGLTDEDSDGSDMTTR